MVAVSFQDPQVVMSDEISRLDDYPAHGVATAEAALTLGVLTPLPPPEAGVPSASPPS